MMTHLETGGKKYFSYQTIRYLHVGIVAKGVQIIEAALHVHVHVHGKTLLKVTTLPWCE